MHKCQVSPSKTNSLIELFNLKKMEMEAKIEAVS